MRVLVDTNILLDYLLEREPYEEAARFIVKASQQRRILGCIAAHSVTNIFFILRKVFSVEERKSILLDICRLFEVEGIDFNKIEAALLNEEFQDFEDCLQMECARNFHADYIVTRNPADFKNSDIVCIEPEQFCRIIENV